eukprot:CAMPEP_0177765880 /NCGR_PEP_ID=MMETSP0491_2-20121128/8222_1 /TAXON_ID=63592 /ORGANISM="Tetraselmis chuii, Strain PLY429" /LENGTH=232 /DNA_ID=CAMNT_0019282247 /DNA_START=29 /DNA_END=728 /DNA_ORIENTATION=+
MITISIRLQFRLELQSGQFTIVDLAAGHGLTAWMLLAMEPACRTALCVDVSQPESAGRLEAALVRAWPRLAGRVRYCTGRVEQLRPHSGCLLFAIHACGPLTDCVLDLAEKGNAPLAVVPCCHSAKTCDTGGLEAWLPLGAAVDATRVARLRRSGYDVSCSTISADITPENRVILASPPSRRRSEGDDDATDDHNRQLPHIWPIPLRLPDSPWRFLATSMARPDSDRPSAPL